MRYSMVLILFTVLNMPVVLYGKPKYKLVTDGSVEETYYLTGKRIEVLPIPPTGKVIAAKGEKIFISKNGKYYAVAEGQVYVIDKGNGNHQEHPLLGCGESWPKNMFCSYRLLKVYSSKGDRLVTTIQNIRQEIEITRSGYTVAFSHGGDLTYEVYDLVGNWIGAYKELVLNYRGDGGVGYIGSYDKRKWMYVNFKTGQQKELSWMKPSYTTKEAISTGYLVLNHYNFLLLDSGYIVQTKREKTTDGKTIERLIKYDLNGKIVLEKQYTDSFGSFTLTDSHLFRVRSRLYAN